LKSQHEKKIDSKSDTHYTNYENDKEFTWQYTKEVAVFQTCKHIWATVAMMMNFLLIFEDEMGMSQ
jgi:hypothetical protein